ncbi:MAG: hypothetical protein FJ147_24735 [Deltaproteobacteria bacterium]|nr:hypothetical protein [Deltaproteobacteria bacterium]
MINNAQAAGGGQSRTLGQYVRSAGFGLLSLFVGLTLERLSLTSSYLTNVIPSKVGQLQATVTDQAEKQQRVMDENQRLKGLIGREQACQDALNICQNEKKKCEEVSDPRP